MADPIEQFQIVNLVPLAKIGSTTIAFTNSAFYMALAVGLTAALMLGATTRRPRRTARGAESPEARQAGQSSRKSLSGRK